MKKNRHRIKVISIGDKGVGKSCLIKRYCEAKFVKSYIETVIIAEMLGLYDILVPRRRNRC